MGIDWSKRGQLSIFRFLYEQFKMEKINDSGHSIPFQGYLGTALYLSHNSIFSETIFEGTIGQKSMANDHTNVTMT